jgi:hypothetical protein
VVEVKTHTEVCDSIAFSWFFHAHILINLTSKGAVARLHVLLSHVGGLGATKSLQKNENAMGLFDDLKAKGTDFRVSDEALYAEALREIETGVQRGGVIWAMALVEAGMDHTKAPANYIRMRVQALKDEVAMLVRAAKAEAHQREAKRIQSAGTDSGSHSDCGGVIERMVANQQVTWTCRKCHTRVAFDRGVGRA